MVALGSQRTGWLGFLSLSGVRRGAIWSVLSGVSRGGLRPGRSGGSLGYGLS